MRSATAIVLAAALLAAVRGHAEPLPELECMIEPRTRVAIGTAVEAVIEEVSVDRGDRVARGDVLVRLEADAERAAVELARLRAESKAGRDQSLVRLSFAQRALERQNELSQSDVISPRQLDEAESSLALAEVGLSQAEEQQQMAAQELERSRALLELRTLRSPIDGVVVERHKSPGELASEQPIVEVVQIDPLHVEVLAPVELFGRIEEGAIGIVRPEGPVGGEYPARVVVIDPIIDGTSGTFRVRLELPNAEHRIPAGLACHLLLDARVPGDEDAGGLAHGDGAGFAAPAVD